MDTRTQIEKLEIIQNLLVARAQGEQPLGADAEYREVRDELVGLGGIADKVPSMVRTCRDLATFWAFIQPRFKSYKERREYIREQFGALFQKLEAQAAGTVSPTVAGVLARLDSESVQVEWQKALDRCHADPEGALTIARTLVESVCKHILDEAKQQYEVTWDLPKLYRETGKLMRLAPDQHSEVAFKSILGGCTSVVDGLANLRNRLGDAHGKGATAARPRARHAELGVSMAGAVANFLVQSWLDRKATLNRGPG